MVTVTLLDFIGENTKEFFDALPKDDEDVTVEINSPGGSADAGMAIFNKLNDLGGKITVDIMGMAASAASMVAMAGDIIKIRDNARIMIHNPFSFTGGDAKQLQKTADELTKLESQVADIYALRTGIKKDKILTMMKDETWLTADQAVKQGFATEKVKSSAPKAKNYFNEMSQIGYANIPEDYKQSYIEFNQKEQEKIMIKAVMGQLGVEKETDVLAKIKELQAVETITITNTVDNDNAVIMRLQADISTQKTTFEKALTELSAQNQTNTDFRKVSARENAEKTIKEMISGGVDKKPYLTPAQKDGAMALYDASVIANDPTIFDNYVETTKAGGVNKQALELLETTGHGGDGRNVKGKGDPEALYMARVDEVMIEQKCDFTAADAWVRANEADFTAKYEAHMKEKNEK